MIYLGENPAKEWRGHSALERAVERELKRLNLIRSVAGSHRTAGTVAIPVPAAKPAPPK